MMRGDVAAALELLQRAELPGLNAAYTVQGKTCTLLHAAVRFGPGRTLCACSAPHSMTRLKLHSFPDLLAMSQLDSSICRVWSCLCLPHAEMAVSREHLVKSRDQQLSWFNRVLRLPEVGCAIVERDDFTCVNLYTNTGLLAIHMAALNGFTDVCRAILRRKPGSAKLRTALGNLVAADFARPLTNLAK